jgi:arsenate reductase (glutaredoxin)
MLTIYHNPKCKKSREGLKYIQDRGIKANIINYINDGISEDELRDIIKKLNLSPSDIVRKQEDIYKKELKGKNFTDIEWIRILTENPKLIQRPIVVTKYKAVIAQPPEKVKELL